MLHPMLATGNSAIAAVDRLKEAGVRTLRILCTLATSFGIEKVKAHHPDVATFAAPGYNDLRSSIQSGRQRSASQRKPTIAAVNAAAAAIPNSSPVN